MVLTAPLPPQNIYDRILERLQAAAVHGQVVDLATISQDDQTADDILAQQQNLLMSAPNTFWQQCILDASYYAMFDRIHGVRPFHLRDLLRLPFFERRSLPTPPTLIDDVPENVSKLVKQWITCLHAQMVWDWDDDSADPKSMSAFPELLKDHLPERADADSWIVDEILAKLNKIKVFRRSELPQGDFVRWRRWMDEGVYWPFFTKSSRKFHKVLLQKKPRQEHDGSILHYIGSGGPGRFVFFCNRGFAQPMTQAMLTKFENVQRLLTQAEILLVRLTHRIARYVMTKIFEEYMVPSYESDRCPRLTAGDVAIATTEIVGAEFFKLPFAGTAILCAPDAAAVMQLISGMPYGVRTLWRKSLIPPKDPD